VLGLVPPGRGFASLASDEPVGRYPTIHHPETKPTTPTTKNPPKRAGRGSSLKASISSDEPVGQHPTLTTPQRGGNAQDPTTKTHPKGGKGVISETHGLLTPPMA